MRDHETEESVDDESPNLAAEAANAGRQLFETIQRSEQNTKLVTAEGGEPVPATASVVEDD